MSHRVLMLTILGLMIAAMTMASACASLQAPDNPTTQALGGVSAAAGTVAPVVAATAPAPWGAIIAAILGAVGVIAGIVAHSATSSVSAQQAVNAVTTGLQAASQSLNAAPSQAIPDSPSGQ
jgi:hypothetical protein